MSSLQPAPPKNPMFRASEHWNYYGIHKPGTAGYHELDAVLLNINIEALTARALAVRRRLEPELGASVRSTIDLSRFATGSHSLVLEVAFSDGVYWVARIAYRHAGQHVVRGLLSEITTLQAIRDLTAIRVPAIYHHDVSDTNPVGYHYMLMECLPGRTLGKRVALAVPEPLLPKVASQLALLFMELQKVRSKKIGRIYRGQGGDEPPTLIPGAEEERNRNGRVLQTSWEFFYNQRQRYSRAALAAHPGDRDWLTACWVQKSALAWVIGEQWVHGEFPLCHMHLSHRNILFDDEYNIVGICNWSAVQFAPTERLTMTQEFATFPTANANVNQLITGLRKQVAGFMKKEEQRLQVDKRPEITGLADFMLSSRWDIVYRCTFTTPELAYPETIVNLKPLLYGEAVSWAQLTEMYANVPYY